MRLTGLELSDFLSYRSLELDLGDVHQMAVTGKNGHGKSALLDGIMWCLFAEARASTDELVREGAGSMYVRTRWERLVDGRPTDVVITRSRSRESQESSLSVTIDGESHTRSKIPLTQAYIERLLGMSSKAMLAGPVMVQGDSAALLEASPATRKDLLVELFQLERWEAYHEEAKTRRKALGGVLDRIEAELSDIDVQVADYDDLQIQRELDEWRGSLASKTEELEALREKVTELRSQAAVLQERHRRAEEVDAAAALTLVDLERQRGVQAQMRNSVQIAEGQATQVIPDVPPEPDGKDLDAIRTELATIDERIADGRVAQARLAGLRNSLETVRERALTSSPCEGDPPTCRYLLLAQEAAAEATRIEAQIAEVPIVLLDVLQHDRLTINVRHDAAQLALKTHRAEHFNAATKAATLTAQRDAAHDFLTTARPQLEATQVLIDSLTRRHADLTHEKLALQQDEFAMAKLAEQIASVTVEGTTVKGEVDELTKAIHTSERFRAEMGKVFERRRSLLAERTTYEGDATVLDQLVKAFHRDGIPTLILETALPEIEGRANDILARLPDDYSIRLDTKSLTKAGTTKDELRVTVITGGRERSYQLLSGGQRFRVDFALRIALAAVIAARVEATVDTLWLDEPLGPLDREGQEAVADTLAAVSGDFGLIAVVSHVPDFNDRFETRLAVTMEDGVSSAVLG